MTRMMMAMGLVLVIGCGPKLPSPKMVEARMRDALLTDPRYTVDGVFVGDSARDEQNTFSLSLSTNQWSWELKFTPTDEDHAFAMVRRHGSLVFDCSFMKDLTVRTLGPVNSTLSQAEKNAFALEAKRLMGLFKEACRP